MFFPDYKRGAVLPEKRALFAREGVQKGASFTCSRKRAKLRDNHIFSLYDKEAIFYEVLTLIAAK